MRFALLILRLLLAALLFLLALEASIRLGDLAVYGAPFLPPYSSENLFLRDALGKRGRPGGNYHQWHMNSLGFRGPELDWSRTRIVCFGASEMFGMFEDAGQELPQALERDLNAAAPARFQVVNAALPGESTATALRRVPAIAAAVRPSFALIYPSLAPYITLSAIGREGAQAAPAPSFEWRIPGWFSDTVKARLPMSLLIWYRQYQIRKGAAGRPLLDRLPEENIQKFQQDSLALVQALRARGIQPVLITHATVFGNRVTPADRYLMLTWRSFYPTLKESGFLDMERRMNAALRTLAAQYRVPLIDLASLMPPSPQYFADAVHFNAAGDSLAASTIASRLKPFLDAPSPAAPPDPSPTSANGTSRAPIRKSAPLTPHGDS